MSLNPLPTRTPPGGGAPGRARGVTMPIQTTNIDEPTGFALQFAAADLTWIIAPGVVVASEDAHAVFSQFSGSTLINSGLLSGGDGVAVEFEEINSTLSNAAAGQIYGAVVFRDEHSVVENLGQMFGDPCIEVHTMSSRIFNSGTMHSGGNAIFYLPGGYNAHRLFNTGEINGVFGAVVGGVGGPLKIDNSGVMASGYTTIMLYSSPGALTLRNFGLIQGDYTSVATPQADVLRNAGVLATDFDLFGGADLYDGRAGSAVGYSILGGAGSDTLRGGAAEDMLYGQADADLIQGKAGDDALNGGAGADLLTGGAGADRFDYDLASDSETASGVDRIGDFSAAEHDLIDLRAIDAKPAKPGDQGFDFLGAAAFTNKAGQLRWVDTGDDVEVQGDLNGDGLADLVITVLGVSALTQADFAL